MSYIYFYPNEEKNDDGYYSINLNNDDMGRIILERAIDIFKNEAEAALEVFDCDGVVEYGRLMKKVNDELKKGYAEARANAEAQGQPDMEVDNPE